MIAISMVAFMAIGLAVACGRAAVSQQRTNVHSLTVEQLLTLLQTNGPIDGVTGGIAGACSGASNTATPSVTIATGATLASVSELCTVTASNVTVGSVTKTVKVPQVTFTITDGTLLGTTSGANNVMLLNNFN